MKRYLVLANGIVLEGEGFGADCERTGELVFTTGMCGYIETLTDPSYMGQIVMQTFPQIGNYGVIGQDFEGAPALFGYVVGEWCRNPSNFRSGGTVDGFLREHGIPGISGIDTRELTRTIRSGGVMNARICAERPDSLDEIKAYSVTGAVAAVSTGERSVIPAIGERRFRVALIDYGAKANIARCLAARGCEVSVFPYNTKAEEITAGNYDGVMLSNGPGDPAENTECIAELAKLLGRLPMFGICLGHQLLALAAGGETRKLLYGHRGANQPVRCAGGSRTYITSQNHGYAVTQGTPGARELYINANDGTNEGLEYPELRAFSVQFHPEAASGPHDAEFLFDRFISMMEVND